MAVEVLAALFHFDEDVGLPDKVGEGGAAVVFFDALFADGTGLFDAGLTERLEEAVKEDLRFALFIAGDVLVGPVPKCGQVGRACGIHGGIMSEGGRSVTAG